MGKTQMEFIARVTLPDGRIVEKKVEVTEGIPSAEETDFSSVEGYLKSFDKYERAVLKARNKIGEEITQGYYEAISLKRGRD